MSSLNHLLSTPALIGIKQRNQYFDSLFYDVGTLTEAEKRALSPIANREGSVILVSPQTQGRAIESYANARALLESEATSFKAMVVAGVGSSVVGTAALARNIANVYDIDVVGVVSGYGAADLITEALGGWFFYGAADALRYQLRKTLAGWSSLASPGVSSLAMKSSSAQQTAERVTDYDTVFDILCSDKINLSLLLGHSKGNLIIDHALERFNRQYKNKQHRYFKDLHIVSLGAVTNFPPSFQHIHQFIGAIDWFGGMNSRFDLDHTKIEGAWHHLNTDAQFSMDVEAVLKNRLPLSFI